MQSEKSTPGAYWLKTAPKKVFFYHTFVSCQKLGQSCFVFELVLGAVPTAIRYNLTHVMTEYIAKYHIDGCRKSMPFGSICFGQGLFPLTLNLPFVSTQKTWKCPQAQVQSQRTYFVTHCILFIYNKSKDKTTQVLSTIAGISGKPIAI